jgi:hypothetical protein
MLVSINSILKILSGYHFYVSIIFKVKFVFIDFKV